MTLRWRLAAGATAVSPSMHTQYVSVKSGHRVELSTQALQRIRLLTIAFMAIECSHQSPDDQETIDDRIQHPVPGRWPGRDSRQGHDVRQRARLAASRGPCRTGREP